MYDSAVPSRKIVVVKFLEHNLVVNQNFQTILDGYEMYRPVMVAVKLLWLFKQLFEQFRTAKIETIKQQLFPNVDHVNRVTSLTV